MEPHDPHTQDKFAGFEDVVALIESAAVEPEPFVQASHIQTAARAAGRSGVRRLQPMRRSTRPTRNDVRRRVAFAMLAAVFGVSSLAVAGVLPDGAQNAVAGAAELIGIRLPMAPPSTDRPHAQDPPPGNVLVTNDVDVSTADGDDSEVSSVPQSEASPNGCDDSDIGDGGDPATADSLLDESADDSDEGSADSELSCDDDDRDDAKSDHDDESDDDGEESDDSHESDD